MNKINKTGPVILLCAALLLILPVILIAAEENVEYTIQRGDTLWDISSGKLKDPFLWPKLWKANPQIHNPHLIYPDQKLVIPAELLKEELRAEAGAKPGHKGKLIKPLPLTSKLVPMEKIRPIVTREVLLQSGFFMREFSPVGMIGPSLLGKTLLGVGDVVYLSTDVKANPNMNFYVTSLPEIVVNPLNEKETAGYLVRIKGVAQVVGEENGRTKAVITESYKDINTGDKVANYYPVSLPFAPAIERKPAIYGTVLGVWDKRISGGKDDVVYINRGAGQGVEIGDIYTITSATPPNPVVGTMQVFSVSDAGSAAIIKQAMSEMRPGDTFGN